MKWAANTLRFIEDRLLLIRDELELVERDVEDYRRNNNVIDADMADVVDYIEDLNELESNLTQIEVEQNVLDYIESYFSTNKGAYQLLPANLTVEDPTITNHISSYNEAVLKRNRLLRSAGEENPALKEIEREIASLESIISAALIRLKQGIETSRSSVQNKINLNRRRLNTIPRKQRELMEITRQQRIKENLYVYLLEKREETALSLAIATVNSRLIDASRLPKSPIEPRKMLVYAAGFLFGLGLPAVLLFLKVLLNDTIEMEEDIKNETTTPILGGISQSKSGKSIVVNSASRSAIAEMFRLLRTNLHFFGC
jgi:tyrosine-protein kinase Etk/Wzc